MIFRFLIPCLALLLVSCAAAGPSDEVVTESQRCVQTHTRGLAELFFAVHDAAFGPDGGVVTHVQSWPDGSSIEIEIEVLARDGEARTIEIRDVAGMDDARVLVRGDMTLERLTDGTVRVSSAELAVNPPLCDSMVFTTGDMVFAPAARPVLAATGTLGVVAEKFLGGLFARIELRGDGSGDLRGDYESALGASSVEYSISLD